MRKLLLAILAILIIGNCALILGAAVFLTSQLAFVAVPVVTARNVVTEAPTAGAVAQVPRPALQLTPTRPSPTAVSAALQTPPADPPDTLSLLMSAQAAAYDRLRLAQEYQGAVANHATPAAPRRYQIGDKETFWVNRDLQKDTVRVTATLRYMNNVVYMWVEDGERVNDADLRASADYFASKIYPTNRKYLGSEPNPGIDNDPRLHILNTHFSAAGYFSPLDVLPAEVYSHSNEKEMFYINNGALHPGSDLYNSVLAHEFAHMLHHNQNLRGEASWVTEGFGDLGIELNGYETGHTQSFAEDPDLQLTAWDVTPGASIPHYGAAYLFLSYQLNRFGVDYIRDLFSSNQNGIASFEYVLAKYAPGIHFDDVFADWVVANFINAASLGKRYSYGTGELGIRPTAGYSRYPAQGSDTVHQYGTDYIQLLPQGRDVTFTFDGSDTVRVIPTDPHSGKRMWWSGRTDASDSKLTRAFDLTGVKSATLKFWTWYSIEDDWDYAYISASTDGGKTWKTLKGNTTTDRDPNAANLGNGFSCKSGAGCGKPDEPAQWIQEQVDLTPYAGKKILLRFEQVTDVVYAAPGLAVDDIEIPEIGFKDDAENGDNGWITEGFSRMDNVLPQKFIVQAIEFAATPRVVQIPLDANNRGTYATKGFGTEVSRVVITVSGSTPITWELADYQYQIQ